jgi:hypothetical protein
MAGRIKTDKAPHRECAVAACQVLRLHPESFSIAPYDKVTARRWDWYRLRRSCWKSTWATRRPRTSRRVLLVLVTEFSLRQLLSRGDWSWEKIIFPNGMLSVVGCDSHENSDGIKLPSASFLLGHIMDNDYSLPRRVLNMQKSSESAGALNSAPTFIKLWGW